MKRYFETACMPLRATTLGFRNHPFLDIFLEKIHFHDSFYCKHSCNSNPSSRQYFLSAHDMLTLCVKHFITTHRSQGESESERVQATCLRFPSKWQTLDRNSSVWQQSPIPAQSGLPEALLVLGLFIVWLAPLLELLCLSNGISVDCLRLPWYIILSASNDVFLLPSTTFTPHPLSNCAMPISYNTYTCFFIWNSKFFEHAVVIQYWFTPVLNVI